MFCLIALIIFSVLGIFSATHRQLAKEALDCVFRRVTLRPCNTGFDKKIKGKVIGQLLNRSPKLARGINRFWEPISWFLVILFFVSLFFSGKSVYNLIKYKNCNPEEPQSCIFVPQQDDLCECGEDKIICKDKGLGKDTCKTGECDDCETCDK